MKKNFNFILVHGWAFDSSFWSGLKILLEKKTFCSDVICIDLGFFLSESDICKLNTSYIEFIYEKRDYFPW